MMPISIFRMMTRSTAAEAAARFGADPDSVEEVRHSANFVFRFTRQGLPHYLRIAHESWRGLARIGSELALMESLRGAGVPVVRAVTTANDEHIVALPAAQGSFLAVALEAVPGHVLDAGKLTDADLRAWGAALARFHEAALDYTPPGGLARHTWQDDLLDVDRWLEPDDAARGELETVVEWMRDTVTRPDVELGVIHHDFQPDNLVRDGETLYVLDLDDAATYPLAADVAFALHAVRDEPTERRQQIRRGLVEGYRSVRPLSDACVDDIAEYVHLRDLWHYAMIDVGHRNAPDLPDWIEALRVTLRDRVGERMAW